MLEVADNMNRLKQEARDMGLELSRIDTAAIEQANDSFSELKIVFENIVQVIAAEVAPYLIAISRYLKNAITEGGNFGKVIRESIIPAIKIAAQAFAAFIAVVVAGKLVAVVSGIVQGFIALVSAIRTATTAMAAFNAVVGANPIAKIATAVLGIVGAVWAIDKVTDTFSDLDAEVAKVLAELEAANAEMNNFEMPDLTFNIDGLGNAVESFADLRNEIRNAGLAFAQFNRQRIEDIELATRGLGLSREQIELERARLDIARRAESEIQRLEEKRRKLSEGQVAAGLGTEIEEQIAQIKRIQEADTQRTEAAIKNSQRRQEQDRFEQFERSKLLDVEKQIRQVQDQIATSTMTTMERMSYEIRRNAEETALAEIRAEEARRGSKLSQSEIEGYYRAARQGAEDLMRAQQRHYELSRTWATGWRRAFNEYVENATNSARLAEEVFRKTTKGLEDMLVNFVKTGKFEWKSFVADMAETLLRSQIQQLIAKTFSSDGIFGKLGDALGLGSLFGGGGGGQPRGQSPNTPLFVQNVGGAGGAGAASPLASLSNLFGGGSGSSGGFGSIFGGSTPGGTPGINPNAGGSVFGSIGNIASGIGNVVSSIGSSVGKVASGIGSVLGSVGKSLFGGFFATGGMIPPGRFGVVGERGPEFISGPANITPMSGGNVTYNINAVDAASFKQLVARDPGFIHAVAMQGASAMPSRR
jgi:lambda family phage tail tape measure protein